MKLLLESWKRYLKEEKIAWDLNPPRILSIQPTTYEDKKVAKMILDIGSLEQYPSAKIPNFNNKLLSLIPTLKEHGCSYKKKGGFVRRLTEDDGTYFGHILEHVALELQSIKGHDVYFGRTRGTGDVGVYSVIYEIMDDRVGIECGNEAYNLLLSILPS